jgi:hypothetical protein
MRSYLNASPEEREVVREVARSRGQEIESDRERKIERLSVAISNKKKHCTTSVVVV